MLDNLPRLPLYVLFRSIGRPRLLPMSLTVSLTLKCNSRCKTCRVFERRCEQMDLAQYERIFRSLGRAPRWVTFSGGEPFLREDLADICTALVRNCRPTVVNIPTNGILDSRIPSAVEAIATTCRNTRIIVNLSLDGVGSLHDEIRGVPGNFERALRTYHGLKEVQRRGGENLSLGIHTVISRFNVAAIPDIVPQLLALEPDSYITEIAENRVELSTLELDITPDADQYATAIDLVKGYVGPHFFRKMGKLIQAFRWEYYDHVKGLLSGQSARWPCHAGFASAQIMPDGEVWACCIKGQIMGNLHHTGFDFPAIWSSDQADGVRRAIQRSHCQCPLANSSYTNMLLHPPTLMVIGARALGLKGIGNRAKGEEYHG